MTVVNPKSISGINSITMASGSDNLLTIHSNNTTERVRVDSSGNLTATSFSGDGSSLTGVASTENIRTNTNATFLQNVTVVGTSTVTGNIVPSSDSATDIGTNSVRFQNAYVDTYYGDGSNLTGVSADVVDDTTPQLGGDLDTNTKNIKLGDSGTPGASGDDTLIFGADDDMRMYHDGANGYISNNTGAFVIQDSHAGANAIIIRKSAEVELMHNNVLACETSSNGLAFPNGKGIDFSATSDVNQSSELLDDYEEGTFTPTARGNNNNSSPVIEGTGKYTRIGRLVQCTLHFSNENGSYLPSGEYIQIHGLPFTADGTHVMPGPGMNYKVVFNSSYQYYWYLPNNGTIMWGYINVSDSPYTPWGTDQWDNTQWYHSNTFTYMTDT